jgi:hypothetical protein
MIADYVGQDVGVVVSIEKWSVSYQWMLEVARTMATVFLNEI